jgi:hypothetical protein
MKKYCENKFKNMGTKYTQFRNCRKFFCFVFQGLKTFREKNLLPHPSGSTKNIVQKTNIYRDSRLRGHYALVRVSNLSNECAFGLHTLRVLCII